MLIHCDDSSTGGVESIAPVSLSDAARRTGVDPILLRLCGRTTSLPLRQCEDGEFIDSDVLDAWSSYSLVGRTLTTVCRLRRVLGAWIGGVL